MASGRGAGTRKSEKDASGHRRGLAQRDSQSHGPVGNPAGPKRCGVAAEEWRTWQRRDGAGVVDDPGRVDARRHRESPAHGPAERTAGMDVGLAYDEGY